MSGPERIWAWERQKDNPTAASPGFWSSTQCGLDQSKITEYRRADLPPTKAAALAVPEVAALVEALQEAVSRQPKDDSCDVWASDARAALAALAGKGE